MKKVLSGIQPTGDLHLGNYFGAIQNWVKLQDNYDCTFCIVDYHAITMPYDPIKLRENTWTMAYYLLACGVKAENLFIQSLVPEHTEMCWILNAVTSFGELQRMTQFKDKSTQVEEKGGDEAFISAGLFNYPVLQAADILIYRADLVPVGQDQVQHLELTRNIANRFNFQFGKEYFAAPQPLLTEFPKIMSPADPTRKMSKSLGEKHYINLFAEEARIRKQIKSAVTDTGEETNGEMSAGVKNLFTLLKACGANDAHDTLMASYTAGELKYSVLKEEVADAVVALCTPIRERYLAILADKENVKEQIKAASANIRLRAQATVKEVKQITGLGMPRNEEKKEKRKVILELIISREKFEKYVHRYIHSSNDIDSYLIFNAILNVIKYNHSWTQLKELHQPVYINSTINWKLVYSFFLMWKRLRVFSQIVLGNIVTVAKELNNEWYVILGKYMVKIWEKEKRDREKPKKEVVSVITVNNVKKQLLPIRNELIIAARKERPNRKKITTSLKEGRTSRIEIKELDANKTRGGGGKKR